MTFTVKTIKEFETSFERPGELTILYTKEVADFIATALAKQKEEILKALPEISKENLTPTGEGWVACLSQVREAIEKV